MRIQFHSFAYRYPLITRPLVEIPQLLKKEATRNRVTEQGPSP